MLHSREGQPMTQLAAGMARVAGYRRAGLRIREKNGAPQTGSAIKVDRTVDRWICMRASIGRSRFGGGGEGR